MSSSTDPKAAAGVPGDERLCGVRVIERTHDAYPASREDGYQAACHDCDWVGKLTWRFCEKDAAREEATAHEAEMGIVYEVPEQVLTVDPRGAPGDERQPDAEAWQIDRVLEILNHAYLIPPDRDDEYTELARELLEVAAVPSVARAPEVDEMGLPRSGPGCLDNRSARAAGDGLGRLTADEEIGLWLGPVARAPEDERTYDQHLDLERRVLDLTEDLAERVNTLGLTEDQYAAVMTRADRAARRALESVLGGGASTGTEDTLREALNFYADEGNYFQGYPRKSRVGTDMGTRARAALAAARPVEYTLVDAGKAERAVHTAMARPGTPRCVRCGRLRPLRFVPRELAAGGSYHECIAGCPALAARPVTGTKEEPDA